MQLRTLLRNTLFAATFAGLSTSFVFAQDNSAEVPAAPAAAPAPVRGMPQFPPADAANFTAATPTKDTVNAFLHMTWGYDTDRVWQVQAIQKTTAPGVSKVTVLVASQANPQQIGSLVFFTTPDGGHLIMNEVLPFGDRPFDGIYKTLQAQANGPWRGAESKGLMFVEFADFQCPHCKNAQPVVQKLLQDFPNARYVFENLPLTSIHPSAYKAAVASACVAKLAGNNAFFKFADAVFEKQESLTPEATDTTLNEAATKAGVDAAKVTACAQAPEGQNAVDASVKLAQSLSVSETPTLYVNGRAIPGFNTLPYDMLKKIIEFEVVNDK